MSSTMRSLLRGYSVSTRSWVEREKKGYSSTVVIQGCHEIVLLQKVMGIHSTLGDQPG